VTAASPYAGQERIAYRAISLCHSVLPVEFYSLDASYTRGQGGGRAVSSMAAWIPGSRDARPGMTTAYVIISRIRLTAPAPLRARRHRSFAIFSWSARASGAEVIMATPTRMLGSSPSRNGLSAKMRRSG